MKNNELSDFTIVTVAMSNHKEFLIHNASVLRDLRIRNWIVVGDVEHFTFIPQADNRFMVLKGAVFEPRYGGIAGGVQHSKSLRLGLEEVKTKYVLVLDPDFLILDAGQLANLLSDFKVSGKTLIGTPYFPIWYFKRMNAVAIYLAVTTKRYLLEEIDLYPQSLLMEGIDIRHQQASSAKTSGLCWNSLKKLRLAQLIYIWTLRRRAINSTLDICADTETLYYSGQSEFLEIEITPQQLSRISPHLGYGIGRLCERLLPRKYSYLPNVFNILYLNPNLKEQQVEHYSYKKVLIGGHFRIFGNRAVRGEQFTEINLRNYLNSFGR